MTDLTPEDEALLERARAVGVPTAEDHARVKQRIFAQIGVGAAALARPGAAAARAATPLRSAHGAVLCRSRAVAPSQRQAPHLPSRLALAPPTSRRSARDRPYGTFPLRCIPRSP